MPRVARPDAADKKSDKKPKHVRRLTPRECREVKAYWVGTLSPVQLFLLLTLKK